MRYYENEVLKELVVGEEYTERQISIFVRGNKNALVISQSVSSFSEIIESKKLRVMNKFESYVHQSNKQYGYIQPNAKNFVYIVE